MVKRFFMLTATLMLLAGCGTTPPGGGAGSHTELVASGAPQTTTIRATFAGLTENGRVRIMAADSTTVLELELQKEVSSSFDAMQLKEGEEVWVHYYREVPKIAGISRVKQ